MIDTQTKQASHTPGPWHYQENAGKYTHIVRAGENLFICQLTQDTSGVSEANARLIAAAPALLAALEIAGDALCQTTWELRRRTPKAVNEAIDVVRAAIAAAKAGAA